MSYRNQSFTSEFTLKIRQNSGGINRANQRRRRFGMGGMGKRINRIAEEDPNGYSSRVYYRSGLGTGFSTTREAPDKYYGGKKFLYYLTYLQKKKNKKRVCRKPWMPNYGPFVLQPPSAIMLFIITQAQDLLVRRINRQRVFLATDNACTDESSLHMTRKLLRLPFTKESLVMVTACTRQNLLEVIGYDISEKCFHVPNLTEDEAIQIILDRAIPNCNFTSLPHFHQQILRCFASQISCTIHGNSRNCEGVMTKDYYHPSSLIKMGAWLGGNPTNWKYKLEYLQDFPKLNDLMSKNYHCTKGLQYVVDHCESSCISSDIQRISSYQFFSAWRNFGRTKEQLSLLSGFDEKDNQNNLNKVFKIPTVRNQLACPKTSGGVWKFTKYLSPFIKAIK